MSRIFRINKGVALLVLALLLSFIFFRIVRAQEGSLSVTVTPPLFQLTIGPGESWASNVKIVNNNSYDVTYYADVMNFESEGETGQGKMTPIVEQSEDELPYTLAGWINLPQKTLTIPAGSSGELPFSIKIPADASPGGHYAAILVGTQPPSSGDTNVVKVSSYVTSLIFTRVKGDILEQGRIREFITEKSWYETPAAKFSLRFENIGNTHLQPQGDIKIFNMWGKERGRLQINQKSNFGNVLPKSVRKFEFSWEAESSPFDIGRYSAVVTLGYGDVGKQNTSATTYFWVVPVVPVAATFGTLLLFIIFVVWAIRRYIRRALALERMQFGAVALTPNPPPTFGEPSVQSVSRPIQPPSIGALMAPIKEGVIDLRTLTRRADAVPIKAHQEPLFVSRNEGITASKFVSKYKIFFLFIIVIISAALGAWLYFDRALTPDRSFRISDVVIQEELVQGGN